jgi:hypothetical protein
MSSDLSLLKTSEQLIIFTAKSLGNKNEAEEVDEVEVSISEVRVCEISNCREKRVVFVLIGSNVIV